MGQRKPVVVKKEDPRPTPPPVAPVRTAPVQTPRTDNAMLKRMMEDLDALDTKLSAVSVGEGKIVYLREFSEEAAPIATPGCGNAGDNARRKSASRRDAPSPAICCTPLWMWA